MFTAIVILGIFIVLWCGVAYISKEETGSFLVAFMITFLGCLLYFSIKQHNENVRCLETVQPIIPRIVHLEDSSKKILKYYYEGFDREIEINRTSNNFYLPESLLKIEPCNRTIFIQR